MKVGYILISFPALSESFIVNEIIESIKQGLEVTIYPISEGNGTLMHEDVKKHGLLGKTCYCWKSHFSMIETFTSLFRNPISFIRIFQLPLPLKRKKYLVWRFHGTIEAARSAKVIGVDLLHAHFATMPSWIAMHLSKILHKPYTFTVHAYDLFANTDKKSLRELCSRSSGIIAISEYNRNFLVKEIGADADKIHVIHQGINISKFQRTKKYDPSKKSLLCVARLTEKKGLKYLLMALHLLKKKHPNLQLNIVGKGPEEAALRTLMVKLELIKNVHFLGNVSDAELIALLNSSSIFVLPCVIASNGDRDGIPVSLMEAMAMELPVVSTRISGIPELITNGKEGFLTPQKDSRSLAEVIGNLLADPDLAKELGKKGREKIEREFDITKTTAMLLKFFRGRSQCEVF